MLPRFFDIHGHINDTQYDGDRDAVVARMHEHEVWGIQVGTDCASSVRVVELAETVAGGLYASIGVHPTDSGEVFDEGLFSELAKSSRVVAVGECGLDYSRLEGDVSSEKARQKKLFEQQVDFAVKHNLPLMLHVRHSDKVLADAHRDVLEILREKKKTAGQTLRGNVHFFAQTIDIARHYFELDFTISFTGVITFSHEYDEVIREAPLERLMSETDCPYVAPVPHRGKRNEPVFVEEVVKKIAELRGEDFETVRSALVENAIRSFSIKV
jgi:TatD DNase family protein